MLSIALRSNDGTLLILHSWSLFTIKALQISNIQGNIQEIR